MAWTNGLYVPINKPWYEAFRLELLAFPTARHDDQVDALGLIGQLLDKMIPAQRIVPLKKERSRLLRAQREQGRSLRPPRIRRGRLVTGRTQRRDRSRHQLEGDLTIE